MALPAQLGLPVQLGSWPAGKVALAGTEEVAACAPRLLQACGAALCLFCRDCSSNFRESALHEDPLQHWHLWAIHLLLQHFPAPKLFLPAKSAAAQRERKSRAGNHRHNLSHGRGTYKLVRKGNLWEATEPPVRMTNKGYRGIIKFFHLEIVPYITKTRRQRK